MRHSRKTKLSRATAENAKKILRELRSKKEFVKKNKVIDPKYKHRLLSYEARMASNEVSIENLREPILIFIFSITTVFLVLAPILFSWYFNLNVTEFPENFNEGFIAFIEWVFIYLGYFILFILGIIVLSFPGIVLEKIGKDQVKSYEKLFFVWCFFVLIVLLNLTFDKSELFGSNDYRYWDLVIFTAAFSIVFSIASLIFFSLISLLFYALIRAEFRRKNPHCVIVSSFLSIAKDLVDCEVGGSFDGKRKDILNNLECIATSMEDYLINKIKGGGWSNDAFLAEIASNIAAYIRSLKICVMFPCDNLEDFKTQIYDYLHLSVDGYWGGFGKASSKEYRRGGIFYSAIKIVKAISVAVIPLGALVLIQLTSFELQPKVEQYMIYGSFAWFAGVLLRTFDPSLHQAVSSVKESVNTLDTIHNFLQRK